MNVTKASENHSISQNMPQPRANTTKSGGKAYVPKKLENLDSYQKCVRDIVVSNYPSVDPNDLDSI